MIPLALAAGMAVTFSDGIDWSKTSDDLRFASLKPVMTETEVKRLMEGKEREYQACGVARNENDEIVPYCGAGYSFLLNGGKETVGIRFDLHGPVGKPVTEYEPDPRGGWQWRDGSLQPVVRPKVAPWTTVGFRVGEVQYKRNKEGLYVAQPKK